MFEQKTVEEAAAARAVAQSNKTHYEKKLAEEKSKVKGVEDTARLLEDEFKVRMRRCCRTFGNGLFYRIGRRELSNIASPLRNHGKSPKSNAILTLSRQH